MNLYSISVFFLLFLIPQLHFAQDKEGMVENYCGTDFNQAMSQRLDRNLRIMRSGSYMRSQVVRYIPITFHLVAKDDGSGRYSKTETLDRLCELNAQYTNTDLQFYLADNGGFLEHDNTAWYDGGGFNTMTILTKQPNTVNFYVVNQAISSGSGDVVCGYYSPLKDVVVVGRSCYEQGNTTAMHELGHFFTLPHTFNGLEGFPPYVCGTTAPINYEKKDGSNCETVGDRFCDTGPDYLTARWTCNGSGVSNCEHVDANNESFFPSGRNAMSYSNDFCVMEFSGEQMAAMNIDYDDRSDLHPTNTVTASTITEVPSLNFPLDSSTIAYGTAYFAWSAAQNASQYVFQVSTTPSFSAGGLVIDRFVTGSNLTLDGELSPNTNYYWRVHPFNETFTCAGFTDSNYFSTNNVEVGVKEVEGLSSFSLYPNPALEGQEVNWEVKTTKNLEGQLKIYNIQGQLIHTEAIQLQAGRTSYALDTQSFSNGMYVVSLEFEEGNSQQKMILTR